MPTPALEYGQFPDGTPYAVGWCADPQYQGLMWVSIGGSYDHTTFIVNPHDADIHAIHTRGSDRNLWGMIAIAITHGEP
jgi:hypothetical protein